MLENFLKEVSARSTHELRICREAVKPELFHIAVTLLQTTEEI